MVGYNTLFKTLRILISIELFLNPNFYCQHLCFLSLIKEHGEHFTKSVANLLPLLVSVECLDTGLTKDSLVQQEAILNCTDKKWSSFLCVLGLSSVLHRNINTYYPDCGESRNKLLFNRFVQPRDEQTHNVTGNDIHILFCRDGTIKPGEVFQPNHFVPLLFHHISQKHKAVVDVKGSAVTKKPKSLPSFSEKVAKKSKPDANILKVMSTPFCACSRFVYMVCLRYIMLELI